MRKFAMPMHDALIVADIIAAFGLFMTVLAVTASRNG
jgi:hypothetical protein